jgi:hypothetical protein
MADTPTPTPAQPAQPGTDFSKDLAKALIALAAGLGGRALSNASGNPLTRDVPPQLSQLLDLSVGRTAYQNPLFQATTQGAYAMLPTFARQGTALTGNLSNAIPAAPANTSGGPGLGAIAGPAGLAALAALLGSGSGASGNLSSIANALKKLFGSKPTTPPPTFPPSKPVSPDQFPGFSYPGLGDLPPGPVDPHDFPGYTPYPDPFGNVDTSEIFGPWPETTDPFAPFDPGLLGGAGGSAEDNFGWPRP